jgi:hypothetical protein
MEELPEMPAEIIEETSGAQPERLMEIVIRICDQHGFPRRGKKLPLDEHTPER